MLGPHCCDWLLSALSAYNNTYQQPTTDGRKVTRMARCVHVAIMRDIYSEREKEEPLKRQRSSHRKRKTKTNGNNYRKYKQP